MQVAKCENLPTVSDARFLNGVGMRFWGVCGVQAGGGGLIVIRGSLRELARTPSEEPVPDWHSRTPIADAGIKFVLDKF